MKTATTYAWMLLLSCPSWLPASGLPVDPDHPRLLLTSAHASRLQAKVAAGDPSWVALRDRADVMATYAIFPYKYVTNGDQPPGTIFYTYQGGGWFDAAFTLGIAFRMTGDPRYSGKLLELADEMVRAQYDPENNPPIGLPPIRPDSYYPTRFVGPALAIIFDVCYDQLGPARKAQLVTLMNEYFDDFRANGYENNFSAVGNYFGGHLLCAGYLGYASHGDNPRAQEMIDYARMRFDGTPSPLVDPADIPSTHFSQAFDGGYEPEASAQANYTWTGAPFKGGFDFQGWAYGTGEYCRITDYLLSVRSATGEDLIAAHLSWYSQILRAEKHALLPNRFEIDPTGDWGGYQGAVIIRSLPARLSHVLAGSADGPGAQYFATSEIADSTYPTVQVYPLPEWEDFVFGDTARPSVPLAEPPFYGVFSPAYPQGGAANGAMPYFLMRSDWSASATWASARMGAAYYGDHQQHEAGHVTIKRGDDYLLVNAANWKGPAGGNGIEGGSTQSIASSSKNTLYFDDFGDQMSTEYNYVGGQGFWGIDEIVANEQVSAYTYVRADLSTAYNWVGAPDDIDERRLESMYRTFLYLRDPDLFVVYDQVKARTSTNPKGPYRKHLRWHFPNVPTIAGNRVQMSHGASRLVVDTLLPANPTLVIVDESDNPDPCDGSDPGCVPNGDDSGTYRVEVSDAANPLSLPFLTVLEPGPTGLAPMTTTAIASLDSRMIGARIAQQGQADSLVLVNDLPGQTPAPIDSTSYAFTGPDDARHVLCGMEPGAAYDVQWSGSTVTVAQAGSGNATASPAGVLYFSFGSCGTGGLCSRDYLLGAGLGAPNPNRVRIATAFGVPTPVDFLAYASGGWGTNVASGPIRGGTNDEILTGPGPGTVFGPHVRAFDRTGTAVAAVSFFAYGTPRYGVNVAAGGIDGDGAAEIVTGAGPGSVFGPHVRGWDLDAGPLRPLAKVSFFAYGTLKYGVNPATGRVDADAFAELLTGPGPGVIFGPQVRGFDYDDAAIAAIGTLNFLSHPTTGYGARVAAGDVDADGFAEIASAPGPGPSHPARFLGYDYDGVRVAAIPGFDVTPVTTKLGGRVGAGDVDGDGRAELLTGAGPDPAADSTVRSYGYAAGALQPSLSFVAFPSPSLAFGVNVDAGSFGY